MATLISELRCSFGWSSTRSELTFSVLDQQGAELTYQINDVRITKSSQDITSLYLTLQFRHTVECSMVKAQTNAKFCELYAGNDPDSKYITTLKGIPIESAKDEFQVEWMDATVKTKVLKLKFISLKKVDPYLMILLLRKFNHGYRFRIRRSWLSPTFRSLYGIRHRHPEMRVSPLSEKGLPKVEHHHLQRCLCLWETLVPWPRLLWRSRGRSSPIWTVNSPPSTHE